GVFMATCIASGVGTLCMAFFANKPFAMAPGMGLNSFYAVVVGNIVAMTGLSYVESFQAVLCVILIEGIVFLLLSILNVREQIVHAIPPAIRMGISPGIGLMLMNIGFGSNVGVYDSEGNAYYMMSHFFGALTPSLLKDQMGESYPTMILTVVTAFVGLFVIIILSQRGVKAAVLLGILVSSIVYWAGEALFLGINPFASLAGASFAPPVGDMVSTTLFKFNFHNLMQVGWFAILSLVITYCVIDMFDTIGTLVGTAQRAGMLDENGDMPGLKQAMISDSVGTIVGSMTGTSTVTTFIESASGVEAGGRTGLAALTTGVLFLLAMFLAPIAGIITSAATSPALIYVGMLMLSGLRGLDFDDISQTVPVFLMLIAMPISGSIGHGIGLALISYCVIKLFTGKKEEVSLLTLVIAVIFLVKFFLTV
ncbi:MAG: NCS2 family permease, partial [Lachnospiraceae bacterium]|nr:NCS2 family permease [Lachnospiraceae bacterium]